MRSLKKHLFYVIIIFVIFVQMFPDICRNPSNSSIIIVHWNSLEKHYVIRAVVSGEARGAAAPLGPVEIDASSLWMDLFSLDSVILIIKSGCQRKPGKMLKMSTEGVA